MRTKQFLPLMLLLTLIIATAFQGQQDAASILKRMDDVMYASKDMRGTNRIVLTAKSGSREVREATIMQMGNDHRLMRFTAPASQAGIAVLSLPNDVMYVYLPAFGRERRIASSAKNQNFAGTDFSYDDMEAVPFSEKYTPKLLRREGSSFVLELTPKGRSAYSRVLVWVHGSNYYPEKMEYYNRGNRKVKEAKYTFRRVGKYWNTAEIEMVDLASGHKTSIQMHDVKYDTGLTRDDFSIRNLKQ
jgi:outer membrane lipoprotein-sorting protein